MGLLFTDELRRDLAALPRPHPSFLVSLCVRDEAPIQRFRAQIERWFERADARGQEHLRGQLSATDNTTFFQGFAEIVVHESMAIDQYTVQSYPGDEDDFFLVAPPLEEPPFALTVRSIVPDVQEQTGHRQFRELLDELSRIDHHYFFSAFLRSWLPHGFDPRPVRRALAVWLDSLDDGVWEGKYAEYRDGPVHIEFSILDKLSSDRDNLARFRIPPLDGVVSYQGLESSINRAVLDVGGAVDPDVPIVVALFNNNRWNVPDATVEDWLLGKADYTYTWQTLAGRNERVKAVGRGHSLGLFQQEQNNAISGVLLADKRWVRDEVQFGFRFVHNPWSRAPLSGSLPSVWHEFRPIQERDGQTWLTWRAGKAGASLR